MKRLLTTLLTILMLLGIYMPISAEDTTVGDLKIGDKIVMGEWSDNDYNIGNYIHEGPIEGEIVAFDHEGYPDNSATLWTSYALQISQFNEHKFAAEYIDYRNSYIKKLAQNLYNTFTETEKKAVLLTDLPTVVTREGEVVTIQDYVFSFSGTELGGTDEYGKDTGCTSFDFTVDQKNKRTELSNGQYTNGMIYGYFWTRSAFVTDEEERYNVLYWNRGGGEEGDPKLTNMNVGIGGVGFAPACNISQDTPVYLWSDGKYHLEEDPNFVKAPTADLFYYTCFKKADGLIYLTVYIDKEYFDANYGAGYSFEVNYGISSEWYPIAINSDNSIGTIGPLYDGQTFTRNIRFDKNGNKSASFAHSTIAYMPLSFTTDLTDITVKEGEDAMFTVETEGHTDEYIWTITKADGAVLTETTNTNTYTFNDVTSDLNGTTISCEVKSTHDESAQSSIVTLTVTSDQDTPQIPTVNHHIQDRRYQKTRIFLKQQLNVKKLSAMNIFIQTKLAVVSLSR